MIGTILLVALLLVVFVGSMTNPGMRLVKWVMANPSRRIVSGLIAMVILILLALLTRSPLRAL